MHLVTFDVTTDTYTDVGPVFLETGGPLSGVNSIAITEHRIYTFSKITEQGKPDRYDLVSFPRP